MPISARRHGYDRYDGASGIVGEHEYSPSRSVEAQTGRIGSENHNISASAVAGVGTRAESRDGSATASAVAGARVNYREEHGNDNIRTGVQVGANLGVGAEATVGIMHRRVNLAVGGGVEAGV